VSCCARHCSRASGTSSHTLSKIYETCITVFSQLEEETSHRHHIWGTSSLLALLFAKLASLVPKVGGHYAYTRQGFGDFAGFWIAWGYWISVRTGNAAIAVALVSYLGGVIPVVGQQLWMSGLVAVGLIWLVRWVNVMGIRQVGVFQVITTVMKLVPLIAMATSGLFWINWSHFVPFNTSGMNPFAAVTAVAALTLWRHDALFTRPLLELAVRVCALRPHTLHNAQKATFTYSRIRLLGLLLLIWHP